MGKWRCASALATSLLVSLAACGGGGSGSAPGGSFGEIGDLGVLSHSPADQDVQVALDAPIEVVFDGPIDREALNEDELTLTGPTESPISGTFTTQQGGRVVVFQPDEPLQKATDYTFTLQPTLCDTSFRTLDRNYSFTFRTFDDIPPSVTASSIADNQVGVSRTGTIAVQFDEPIAPPTTGSVTLKDTWGTGFSCELAVRDHALLIRPRADLPGSRALVLSVRGGHGGVADRSGNSLAETWSIRFTTIADTTPPRLVRSDPESYGSDISPRARLAFVFDESVDPGSYDPAGLRLEDGFLNPVPFALLASPDQRTLYLQPDRELTPGEDYTVTFESGAFGLTDVSGNELWWTAPISFTVGSDRSAPVLSSSEPRSAETRISPNVELVLWYNEALERPTVSRDTVTLEGPGGNVPVTVGLSADGTVLRVIPSRTLAVGTTYTLRLASGYDGVQDRAGNPLDADVELRFTTSASSELPAFAIAPPDASAAVPITARITAVASAPLDPATVNASTFKVKTVTGETIGGSLSVARGDRAIVFRPNRNLPSASTLRVTIAGGYGGVRLANGNWTAQDTTAMFRVGAHTDAIPPELDLTINEIAKTRASDVVVPPSGFTFDVQAYDPGNVAIDPSTLQIELQGPGSVPGPDELFAMTEVTAISTTTRLDAANALPEGDYVLRASVRDLSGNASPVREIRFSVAAASIDRRPFERTQIVWVRFDADREGNGKGDGVADFRQDLIDYGLNAAGDPIGANAKLEKLVTDGALRIANGLFHRAADGSRGSGSVRIRLTTRAPCRAPHMKIAVGGADPSGSGNRGYGDESTGILGRALYDYRNGTPNENNVGTSPGLGVFPGELFLFQARLYLDLYPYYITTFGRTYRGLSPHMGGKPAGTYALDPKVLADDFDYGRATPSERARWDEIMEAADDLAASAGVILAHEIGHSVGLVSPGPPSQGLHGDASLHNDASALADVMGAVIGYESLVSTEFEFRAMNLAYLRERLLLK